MRVYVRHHSPGRIRLRIPQAKRKPEALNRIAKIASALDGVRSADINSITGSVLIRCATGALKSLGVLATAFVDSGLPLKLVDLLAEAEGAPELEQYSLLARGLGSALLNADAVVRSATQNQIDLEILLPSIAGVAGLASLRNSAATTPLWLTLMIFAFTSFVALNQLGESNLKAGNDTSAAAREGGHSQHPNKNGSADGSRS
ncbi:MAG: HMA2 domain-containing protein [Candidatus Binataceae bacterium]